MGVHGVNVQRVTSGSRPIGIAPTSAIGLVGTAPAASGIDPGDTVVVRGAADVTALALGTDGTIPPALDAILEQGSSALVVVHCVEEGEDAEETGANIAGTALDGTGVYALLAAKSSTGVKPKILIAPGFSHLADVASGLISVGNRLLAGVILDGPNTTDADAITLAGSISDADRRALLVDPYVLDGGEARPASPYVAGLVAQSDARFGFWRSPSNQEILGIEGLARPISFELGDANSAAQLLNDENVTTIVRESGFRLWGNRGLGTEPMRQFWSVVRTDDAIAESVKSSHLWAVDQGITRGFVEEVLEGLRAFMRDLRSRGAIINFDAWIDPDLNTSTSLGNGELYIDYDFTPPPPAESITFRSRLTTKYLSQIIG